MKIAFMIVLFPDPVLPMQARVISGLASPAVFNGASVDVSNRKELSYGYF